MTRDEVIAFAHESDEYLDSGNQVYAFSFEELQRAFEAVAAREHEWVGLTKEEAADCWSIEAVKTWHAIEDKLKEKNT